MLYLLWIQKADWEFKKTKEASLFKHKDIKVLVFGNSTAMDGVNTEILSEKFGSAYNFSVGGASLQTNCLQLEKYLSSNNKPEKVVVCLSSAHTNYNKANDINPIVKYLYNDSPGFLKLSEIPLFNFRWLFIENIKRIMSFDHRNSSIVLGQLRIKKTVTDNSVLEKGIADNKKSFQYSDSGYNYLWRMSLMCKERNIPFFVFELPCWKNDQNNLPNSTLQGYYQSKQVGFKIYNLNNYNFCDSVLNPKNDWLSKNHLNFYGSIKITNHIIRYIN